MFGPRMPGVGACSGSRDAGTMKAMTPATSPDRRPGWRRDVAVPRSLDELHGGLQGQVGLPASVFWSGPDPRGVRWDLSDRNRRRDLYEIVLVEGTLDDIRRLVNKVELVKLWDAMYLPTWVRAAWRSLIESAGTAA